MASYGIKRFSGLSAVGTALVVALYDGWLVSHHLAPNQQVLFTYRFVLATLLATWLVADAQERRRDRSTFDYGSWALLLFFLYAPYYLVSTRRARGVLIFAGMLFLFILPSLAEIIASYVS